MRRPHAPPTAVEVSRSRGFTLIELMITIAIIGILTSLGLGALYTAQEHARAVKTQTTIYKLHAAMMERWDGYHYRRLPINTAGLNPRQAARTQLNARRLLMRMELPERWSDVLAPTAAGPQEFSRASSSVPFPRAPVLQIAPGVSLYKTPLALSYGMYVDRCTNDAQLKTYEGAECLYMILSMGEDTSLVSEQVATTEFGDKDGDGLNEFWDAWGNPIHFLRWAPGFISLDSTLTLPAPDNRVETSLQSGLADVDHDPFDRRKLHPAAYALYPLIFSAGPDEQVDIVTDLGSSHAAYPFTYTFDPNTTALFDPYQPMDVPSSSRMVGQPDVDPVGDIHYLDNIHNQLKEQR